MADLDLRLDHAWIADCVRRFRDFMGVLGRRVVEKGDFVIAVGSSSQDIRLQTTVTLE